MQTLAALFVVSCASLWLFYRFFCSVICEPLSKYFLKKGHVSIAFKLKKLSLSH